MFEISQVTTRILQITSRILRSSLGEQGSKLLPCRNQVLLPDTKRCLGMRQNNTVTDSVQIHSKCIAESAPRYRNSNDENIDSCLIVYY